MLTGNMQYDGTSIKSSNGGGDSSVIHDSSTDSVRRQRTSLPSQAISPGEHRHHLLGINWWWGTLKERRAGSHFPHVPHPHDDDGASTSSSNINRYTITPRAVDDCELCMCLHDEIIFTTVDAARLSTATTTATTSYNTETTNTLATTIHPTGII